MAVGAASRAHPERSNAPGGFALTVGIILSALLAFSAFPPWEWNHAVWVAHVPLALLLVRLPFRRAAILATTCTFLFFASSLFFVTRVTYAGWLILCVYCALYAIPMGISCAAWGRWGRNFQLPWINIAGALLVAVCCTGAEHARSIWFTGFGWNSPGIALVGNYGLMQWAEWAGVAVLNVLVYFVNFAIAGNVLRHWSAGTRPRGRAAFLESQVALAVIVLMFFTGLARFRHLEAEPPLRMMECAIVQPNVDQYAKWDGAFVRGIVHDLDQLTVLAKRALPQAEMVIWPETAIPDPGTLGPGTREWLALHASDRLPLLTGSLYAERMGLSDFRVYNSAILFGSGARILERYDKQHLVLVGEYIPFPFLEKFFEAYTPFSGNVQAGTADTLFLSPSGIAFSTLVCFEDIMPYLASRFVRQGAEILINLTNDAWFDPLWGSRQHLNNAVLRCIENRVPMVRSTNSGASVVISRTGRIDAVLGSGSENLGLRVKGFGPARAYLHAPRHTLHLQHGDWLGSFTLATLGCFSGLLFVVLRRLRRAAATIPS